jgi:hypothetical protein
MTLEPVTIDRSVKEHMKTTETVGQHKMPPLPHHADICGQAGAFGTRPEAMLGGERRQPLIPGRLGDVVLRRERRLVQQLTWSGQASAVCRGSGFYEKGRDRFGYRRSAGNR